MHLRWINVWCEKYYNTNDFLNCSRILMDWLTEIRECFVLKIQYTKPWLQNRKYLKYLRAEKRKWSKSLHFEWNSFFSVSFHFSYIQIYGKDCWSPSCWHSSKRWKKEFILRNPNLSINKIHWINIISLLRAHCCSFHKPTTTLIFIVHKFWWLQFLWKFKFHSKKRASERKTYRL